MQPDPFPEDMKYRQPTEPNPPMPQYQQEGQYVSPPYQGQQGQYVPSPIRASKDSQYHHPISTQLRRLLFSRIQL